MEFFRIEDLDERFLLTKVSMVWELFYSLAVDRAQELFSKLDVNNDGDISEEEFIKVCLEDESLFNCLGTKKPFSEKERKEETDTGTTNLARFSMAAENRVTTKRRYSDICTKKKLFYNPSI